MVRLGLADASSMNFRPSLQLSHFAVTQFYTSHNGNDDGSALRKFIKAPGIDEVPWRAIYDELLKLQPLEAAQLGKCLRKVVAAAQESLRVVAATEEEDGPSDGRCETILSLAFFFSCHLLKATSSWNIKSEGGAGRRTGQDTSLLSAAWQLRRDTVRVLCELQSSEYFCASGDAARLLFSTCVDLLTSALPIDAATKPVAEAASVTLTEHLAGRLVGPESTAADALEALLRLAGQPKQSESVIAHVASILRLAMQRNSLAGCSAVAALMHSITGESLSSSSPESLASLVAALAAGADSLPELRASVLSYPSSLLTLLNHPKPGVRRPALDLLTSLISNPPSGPERGSWQELGLAAAMAGMRDKDANLRAKALAVFESKLPDVLAAWQAEGPETPEVEGRANDHLCKEFCCELAARLLDRSLLVRKRAAALTAALATAAQPAALIHALAAKVVPVLEELMQLPPDSKLACPEGTAVQLATALTVFAEPANSLGGALSLLRLLSASSASEEITALLTRALVSACLPSNATASNILLGLLGSQQCSRSDVEQLRRTLQAARRHPALKEQMARLLDDLIAQASSAAAQGIFAELLPLARAIYVLFSADTDPVFLQPQCRWLLVFAQRLGGSLQQQGAAALRPTLEALQCMIDTSKHGLQHLKLSEDAVHPLAADVVALVEGLCTIAPVAQRELHAALSLLKSMHGGYTVLSKLLASLAARSGVAGVASSAPHPRSSSFAGFLAVLAAMAGYYEEEREAFLSSMQPEADGAAGGAQDEEMVDAPDGGDALGDGPSADCLRAEDDRSARDEAGKRFLEELLAAEDSAPACFVPALLEIAAAAGQLPEARAGALRALQGMAVMSQPLCQRCVDVISGILSHPQPQQQPVAVAAVGLLKAAIDAFPTVFAPALPLLQPILTVVELGSARAAAAAAFASLMLANKLKNHEFMGIMGTGLAIEGNEVSSMLKLVLSRLLDTSSPADRPSLVLAVVHQTPAGLRATASRAALGTCSEADRRSDDLVSVCAAAALDAASSLEVGEALLQPLLPSCKVLHSLRPRIEASISDLSPGIKQKLIEFISRAEVRTSGAEQHPDCGGAKKRGRGSKTSDAEVKKELLQLLGTARKPQRGRRHQQF